MHGAAASQNMNTEQHCFCKKYIYLFEGAFGTGFGRLPGGLFPGILCSIGCGRPREDGVTEPKFGCIHTNASNLYTVQYTSTDNIYKRHMVG